MKAISKNLLLRLSPSDFKKLEKLSAKNEMKWNEFIRTIIQLHFIAEFGINKTGKIELGGYGITLPMEMLEEMGNKIADSFSNFDFEKLSTEIKIKPMKRNYVAK